MNWKEYEDLEERMRAIGAKNLEKYFARKADRAIIKEQKNMKAKKMMSRIDTTCPHCNNDITIINKTVQNCLNCLCLLEYEHCACPSCGGDFIIAVYREAGKLHRKRVCLICGESHQW